MSIMKRGIVVTAGSGKIGLMGAHGGGPTLFAADQQFEVGEWVNLKTSTQEVFKLEESDVRCPTHVHNNGLITIQTYLVRFEGTSPQCFSPHVGYVVAPAGLNFRMDYVYSVNVTCYVNSNKYTELMEQFKTAWTVSEEAAEIRQVMDINELTRVESLLKQVGCNDAIELKPKKLDDKDIMHYVSSTSGEQGMNMSEQTAASIFSTLATPPTPPTHAVNTSDTEVWYGFNEYGFRGNLPSTAGNGAAAAAANASNAPRPAQSAPIECPGFPYLGVVVHVEKEIVVVYTREKGNVFVNKDRLTLQQKFELVSCSWVRLDVELTKEHRYPSYKHEITTIKVAAKTEIDEEFTSIEWAVAAKNCTLKLANARLFFSRVPMMLGEGMRALNRRGGESIVYHPFVGEVIVEDRAHRSIAPHNSDFNATVELMKENGRVVWRVTNFVYDCQELTLNGYMSKIGHGKWQQVRDQNLPRLAQQKEKNLTTKNSAPAPNAAVKGSLGWHIPTTYDSDEERERAEELNVPDARGGDPDKENPEAYHEILMLTPSLLAPKVEFNRKMEALDDYKNKNKQFGFTKQPDEAATYSMPPAVTTMPMKMKNEWMGTEGGWKDRESNDRSAFRDKASVRREEEERGKKRDDEEWYDNEYDIDDKGKKKQEGWESVVSKGMVVTVQNGAFIVWMREQNKVISVRSGELFPTAWTDINYMWNEQKKLINLRGIEVAMEDPEGIVAEFDEERGITTVIGVVDFVANETMENPRLESPVLGQIEIHDEEVHEKIWNDDCFMKKLEIIMEFHLEDTGANDMSGTWVMTRFHRVVGDIEEQRQ